MIELNNIHDGFDREVIQQVLLDMVDGRFYTEMDDATLGLSLMAVSYTHLTLPTNREV